MNVVINDQGISKTTQGIEAIKPDLALSEIDQAQELIAIEFANYADGRGFGLASALRREGYKGRLRAKGHILADQYAMARRVGFDEVEVTEELFQRQGHEAWIERADWALNDYQSRLGKRQTNNE